MMAHLFDRLAAVASLVILVALGMVSYWFAQQAARDSAVPAARVESDEPDYFVEQMTVLRTDDEGRPAVRLESRRTVHHPKDHSLEFEEPHLITLNESRPTVEVTADRGFAPESGDSTRLQGNVKMVRFPDGDRPALVATTESADVDLRTKIVTSREHVDVQSGQDRLSGTGMRLDSDARTLQLDSRVRGLYAARPTPPTTP